MNEVLTARRTMRAYLPTPATVLEIIQAEGRLRIAGWSINREGEEIWLTTPYGNDCLFVPVTIEGCISILEMIAAEDRDKEW